MSGKRQHFIPQFLQRGFSSHKSNESYFTWVYRKDGALFNTNIINAGVEKEFYSIPGSKNADDIITNAEQELSIFIERLRRNAPTLVKDPLAPKLIAHLEARSRHIRRSLISISNQFISMFLDFMDDEDAFMEYLKEHFRNNPNELKRAFINAFNESGISANLAEGLLNSIDISDPEFVETFRPMISDFTSNFRSILPSMLENAAKGGHIEALEASPYPEPRVEKYTDFSYKCVKTAIPLILGDFMTLFKIEERKGYKTFLDKDDIATDVILPIDTNTMLIGSKGTNTVGAEKLREATARCSLEHFIASEKSDRNIELQNLIGSEAIPISKADIKEALDTLITDEFK